MVWIGRLQPTRRGKRRSAAPSPKRRKKQRPVERKRHRASADWSLENGGARLYRPSLHQTPRAQYRFREQSKLRWPTHAAKPVDNPRRQAPPFRAGTSMPTSPALEESRRRPRYCDVTNSGAGTTGNFGVSSCGRSSSKSSNKTAGATTLAPQMYAPAPTSDIGAPLARKSNCPHCQRTIAAAHPKPHT